MKRSNQSILQATLRIAKSVKAKAVLLALDPLHELPELEMPEGCQLIVVTRKTPEELENIFPDGIPAALPLIFLPRVDITRISFVKTAMVLGLSGKLITMGDRIVVVAGAIDGRDLDSIFFIDTERETEILATQGLEGIGDGVNPEVFQETLTIALELAARGREGKAVGTTFVLGDEDKVLQLSKQMIINPFKGYSDEERNILGGHLKETLREFSALDGAFIISRDGLVLSAGRYLGAAVDETMLPRGLGSRHIAAAGITALTQALAIVISESTGDVRIFKSGKILMEIEKPTKVSGQA